MANKTNLTIGGVALALLVAYYGIDLQQQKNEISQPQNASTDNSVVDHSFNTNVQHPSVEQQSSNSTASHADQVIAQAFKNKLSNIQVEGSGQVVAVLRDDHEGSRHQKFILRLSNGQTLLVAHNIDLAPRIDNLQKGDTVAFNGEYEYSEKGGVMHWTHLDPNGRHVDGWLKHQGKTYQ